ncbi:MAG: hypothetical protein PV344_06230 [Anaplasma sp.]|nr:hypothetical protein [Anaplasma sp.]
MTHIINNMLQTAIFPDELKIAKVSTVHKEGIRNDLSFQKYLKE